MEDILYTVSETAKLLKTNQNYVYELIKQGFLPALKLGSFKIRKTTLNSFLEKYEGQDLTDLKNIKELEVNANENS
jgi:excisionase family DNA binding protein